MSSEFKMSFSLGFDIILVCIESEVKMYQKLLTYKKTSISLFIVGILFLSFLVWGFIHYSKGHVIDRYIAARSLKKGDTFDNIKEYLVWADTKEKITFDEAKYADFDRISSSDKDTVKEELKSATSSDEVYVTSVGRRFFFFPDYKIAMKPLSLTITTNVNGMDILLNNKKVTTSDSENFKTTVEHLPRASYTAWLVGTYKDRAIKLSKDYDGSQKEINLDVSFKNFVVTSNLADADLYFDKTKIGTLTDGRYEVKDYPLTASAKAYVKKSFSDGSLVSKKKDLSEISENETVAFNVEKQLDDTTAGQLLINAFDQLAQYTTNFSDPSTVTQYFEGGTSNGFYKGLKSSVQSKLITDKRLASQFSIPSILLTSVTQVGKTSYTIGFSATYNFYFDKVTDTKNETYGNVVQNLTGVLTAKKVGDSYQVSKTGDQNITVSSEDSQLKKDKKVEKKTENTLSSFPSALIGTWKGESNGATFTFIFSDNGTITKKVKTDDSDEEKVYTAKVTKLTEKASGLYLYDYDSSSELSAFTVGGIGGVGVKYAYGIKFDGTTATPVIWQAATDDDFDYTQPSGGLSLKKE